MKHELWYSVVVRDRHGKVLSRERRKSRSFLKQWNQLVYVHMAKRNVLDPYTSITDTGGTPRTIQSFVYDFRMNAAAGVTAYGIRVGTGDTPVAIDDYALDEPIAEGVGDGQMEHLVCTVADYIVAAPSCSFIVSRTITNNSPGIITVREATIYMQMHTYYGCGTRDVFDTPQAIPIGGSITIDWTIGVTV